MESGEYGALSRLGCRGCNREASRKHSVALKCAFRQPRSAIKLDEE